MRANRRQKFLDICVFALYLLTAQVSLFVKVWHQLLAGAPLSIPALMVNHKWAMTHYGVHYGFEFVKRGVVGTLFYLGGIPVTYTSVFLFSILCSELVIVLVGFYVMRGIRSLPARGIFLMLFALSPATVMHLGYDLGRYDQVNIVLTVLVLFLLDHHKPGWGRVVLIALLVFTQILVHEASLFITMPSLLFMVYVALRSERQGVLKFSVLLVSLGVAVMLVILFGGARPSTLEDIRRQLAVTLPGFETGGALAVWQRGVMESIRFTLAYVLQWTTLVDLVLSVPLVLLHAYWTAAWFRLLDVKQDARNALVLPLIGLPFLMVLGIDWYRWFSMSVIFALSHQRIHDARKGSRFMAPGARISLGYRGYSLLQSVGAAGSDNGLPPASPTISSFPVK